jgi:hypothetical protein
MNFFWLLFQYLMTKTAAMHFGQGRDLHGHQAGAGGGGGAGSANGREVKPHQCQQCLKAFSSNHQVIEVETDFLGILKLSCIYLLLF